MERKLVMEIPCSWPLCLCGGLLPSMSTPSLANETFGKIINQME
jgi:hypothetical protein